MNLATGGIFQLGYVTDDLESAIEQARRAYDIAEFLTVDTSTLMPGPPLRLAMAWSGSLMIEIIEPMTRPNPVYIDMFPPVPGTARFHHSGHVCSDAAQWDGLLAQLEDKNIAIAHRGEAPGLFQWVYADFRHIDGHYREYAVFTDQGRAFLDQVPGNREPTIFGGTR